MTPEQMKALMAYVVDTAAAVQDWPLHGQRAERSRYAMLASFGFDADVEQQPPAGGGAAGWTEWEVRESEAERAAPMPLHPDHEMNAKRAANVGRLADNNMATAHDTGDSYGGGQRGTRSDPAVAGKGGPQTIRPNTTN